MLNVWDLDEEQKIFLCEILKRSLQPMACLSKDTIKCLKKEAIIQCINHQQNNLTEEGKQKLIEIKKILNVD
jgi:hypothetical protein